VLSSQAKYATRLASCARKVVLHVLWLDTFACCGLCIQNDKLIQSAVLLKVRRSRREVTGALRWTIYPTSPLKVYLYD
jgi:hypothetical protein